MAASNEMVFLIKTMTKTEKDGFLKMLPFLIRHLAVNGGKSLISRIYGVFKVYYKGISPIYLTLQRNNIPIEEGNEIMAKFDLKGSRFTRNVLSDDQIRKVEAENRWVSVVLPAVDLGLDDKQSNGVLVIVSATF